MQTLNYSIRINAPKEEVWGMMLGEEGYRKWTSVFDPGSYFQGSWEEGATIRFFNGDGEGMVSSVVANRLFEFVSVMHQQLIQHGLEQGQDAESDLFPAFEEYAFSEIEGVTKVDVSVDSPDENMDEMDKLFPIALRRLKELCES